MRTVEKRKLKYEEDSNNLYPKRLYNSIQEAKYIKRLGADDNPDICALPEVKTEAIFYDEMSEGISYYDFEEIRKMSVADRKMQINLLHEVRVPMPLDMYLATEIDKALYLSYTGRDIRLHEKDESKDDVLSVKNKAIGRPYSFLLYGESGRGKTNSLNKVMQQYPEAIYHKFSDIEYLQIPIVTVPAPVGNLSALMLDIARNIDDIVGGTRWEESVKNKNIGRSVSIIKDAIRLYHIGLIIIDEAQFINFDTGNGSVENLISLSEQTGCALGFIGNYDLLYKMQNYPRFMTRVMLSIYEVEFETKLDKAFFKNAIECLWKYQFTKEYTVMTEEILDELTKDSLYNIALLKVLIMLVQQAALAKKPKDGITVEYIHEISEKKLTNIRTVLLSADDDKEKKFREEFAKLNSSFNTAAKKRTAKAGRAYLEEQTKVLNLWGGTKYEDVLTALKCFGVDRNLAKAELNKLQTKMPDLPKQDAAIIIDYVRSDLNKKNSGIQTFQKKKKQLDKEGENKVQEIVKRKLEGETV